MKATRFPEQASGPAERMAGFIAHLRMNGLRLGPRETSDSLEALACANPCDAAQARMALKALLVPDHDAWLKFDDLYDAYWFNIGKQKQAEVKADHIRTQSARPTLWQNHMDQSGQDGHDSTNDARPDPGEGEAEGADGRLIATRTANLTRRDLREVMDEDSLREAERAARRLARALRDRRSRRHRIAAQGRKLDLRRTVRASLARGGEPLDLFKRHRPNKPLRLVGLCDVSGSMTVYARVFLAFLKGLIDVDTHADAYLFHTRLMRVTAALRDHDSLRAAGRLSLMAEGFGGGTDIARCLGQFNDAYAARAVNGRSVVIILSDGYCTSPAADLGTAMAKLRRRAHRVIWLNPLLGWKDYAPVARGIAAALPHLDAHLPANTIEALSALEPEFHRL